jgi:hypothetical protein
MLEMGIDPKHLIDAKTFQEPLAKLAETMGQTPLMPQSRSFECSSGVECRRTPRRPRCAEF